MKHFFGDENRIKERADRLGIKVKYNPAKGKYMVELEGGIVYKPDGNIRLDRDNMVTTLLEAVELVERATLPDRWEEV